MATADLDETAQGRREAVNRAYAEAGLDPLDRDGGIVAVDILAWDRELPDVYEAALAGALRLLQIRHAQAAGTADPYAGSL